MTHQNSAQNCTLIHCYCGLVIIVTRGRQGVNCHEYPLEGLDNISLEDVVENTGTIRLVPQQVYYDREGRSRNATPDITTAFLMIDDVHKVYRILLENR